jgi:tetratricopeptide (TPR) repeat protein
MKSPNGLGRAVFWVMRVPVLTLLAVMALQAANEGQLALALQAQSDFDRVEAAATPQPRDTAACVQSQAAVLPVAAAEERPLILFRKGYCALAEAAVDRDASQFAAAAVSFEEAIEAWPARAAFAAKQKLPPSPIPSPLRVFAAVARLEQNAPVGVIDTHEAQLADAVDRPACDSAVAAVSSCQAAVQLGNLWLGWVAVQRGDSAAAARRFAGAESTGWPQWLEGQEAFRSGDYAKAASRYGAAVDVWRKEQREPVLPVIRRLTPSPNMAATLTAFGEAQLLSGNPAAAETLDAAVKADPSKARVIYLRARAKEAAGHAEAALADFNLASRTAFAAAAGRSSGEAHLYQGILLFERKDWPRAEDEFTDALNFDIPASMKSDAAAWRHMAAVASGSCGASREYLEHSLATVSPDFPKDDARSALAACAAAGSAASAAGWDGLK